jgi:RND family efflux transporter MFP subunit
MVPLGSIAAIAATGWFGWQRLEREILQQPVKTTEVALISPSQAEVLVTATGYVVPQRTSKASSKLPGRLAKVFVKEGDTVKEGQVLAQLEDDDQRSQIAAASSKVGVASARIATARANLAEISQQVEREKALVASGAVGKANLDNLVARESALRESVNAAEAETHAARADVGTFGVGLKDRVILAPIGGRIVTKPATVGEFLGGIGGVSLVAEIVDFDSLMVETDVPEARLHIITLGGPAEIVLDAYPNTRYRGIATELGLRVNRAKATVVVKVKFRDVAVNVLPEMSARVSFLSKPITDAALKEAPKLVVASDAVVERNGKKTVFVVESGKLHAFPVDVGGAVGGNAIELIAGPSAGTKVVAKPTLETSDGQRIKETDK